MAQRKPWARPRWRRPSSAPAFALAAALATVLLTAACTAAPAGSGTSAAAGARGSGALAGGRAGTPAVTAAEARQVFDRYVATAAKAVSPQLASPELSLVTGVEQMVLTATLASHSIVMKGTSSNAQAAYSSSLSVKPDFAVYTYGSPAFYLPEASGYPRFFVTSVERTLRGTDSTAGAGGAQVPPEGPALMLFQQGGAGAPWLLASISQLPSGVTLPKLATDGAGYVPTVPLSDASLVAQPDDTGPLQAGVVDEGPASPATRAVADGPLTTGIYQGAVNHVGGLTAPHGDVYQWELDGSSLPQFALRTAAGGALVFYAMTLNTTVAVPDVINKADPVRSGPPIQVPVGVQMLLPPGRPAPLVELSSSQTLSFAATDPAAGNAKIQVIAIGGGLTGASGS
ncbi:MAG TPA: hypothetical protein VHT26_01730 [Trebonia sp.]|nr:hypothetical protein [Trebonia sp.]